MLYKAEKNHIVNQLILCRFITMNHPFHVAHEKGDLKVLISDLKVLFSAA